MKTRILILLSLIAFSCSSGRKDAAPSTLTMSFLALFKPITSDTTSVLLQRDKQEKICGPFTGVLIDSVYWPLMDTVRSIRNSGEGHFYACYRFALNDTTCALVTREPSLYEESNIQLSVFDAKHARCLRRMQLADGLGDAGATFQKFSFIRFDKGVISISIRQIQTGPVDDTWQKFSEQDSTSNYLLLNNEFVLSNHLKNRDSTWIYIDSKP